MLPCIQRLMHLGKPKVVFPKRCGTLFCVPSGKSYAVYVDLEMSGTFKAPKRSPSASGRSKMPKVWLKLLATHDSLRRVLYNALCIRGISVPRIHDIV